MTYKAPLRDINFVANELLNADAHYAALRGCEAAAGAGRARDDGHRGDAVPHRGG